MSLPLTIKLLTKITERMENSPGIPCWEKGKVEAWWERGKAGAWWEMGKAGAWWETGKAGAWCGEEALARQRRNLLLRKKLHMRYPTILQARGELEIQTTVGRSAP